MGLVIRRKRRRIGLHCILGKDDGRLVVVLSGQLLPSPQATLLRTISFDACLVLCLEVCDGETISLWNGTQGCALVVGLLPVMHGITPGKAKTVLPGALRALANGVRVTRGHFSLRNLSLRGSEPSARL